MYIVKWNEFVFLLLLFMTWVWQTRKKTCFFHVHRIYLGFFVWIRSISSLRNRFTSFILSLLQLAVWYGFLPITEYGVVIFFFFFFFVGFWGGGCWLLVDDCLIGNHTSSPVFYIHFYFLSQPVQIQYDRCIVTWRWFDIRIHVTVSPISTWENTVATSLK